VTTRGAPVYDAAMNTTRRHLQISITLAYARGGYSAPLELGSQRCCANVLLDTGSSTLALVGRRYRAAEDSTLKATALAQQVSYGQGGWAGPVLRTRIGLGEGKAARQLDGCAFALVETDAPYFFRDADGILGLAYRRLNHAHDMSTQLAAEGREPALTWPWPYVLDDAAQLQTFAQQLHQLPSASVEPLFSALEAHGIYGDVFALQVGRSVAHVLDDSDGAAQLAGDPLNRGVLVLGGGEECQDLYDGGFQDIRIVHELYYNANLLSVQVGSQEPIPAPPLEAQYQASAASNAIIDTGSSFLALEATIYDAVIAGLAAHDARLPGLVDRYNQQYAQDQRGLPNDDIDPRDWPALHFRFESCESGEVCLSCEPSRYWQRNALYAGRSMCLLMREVPGWANQSVLGLPLLAGRYCIFDRRHDSTGRVRVARSSA
jgi:Xylanase inhibitor C-terminal/Eukaryotic aspartyl protease